MNATREEKKAEAIRRMDQLKIFKQTRDQYEEEDIISISEKPYGAFYWTDLDDIIRIREFEEAHNALVYVVIRSYTNIGTMDSYLYVNDYPEEWEQDRQDLEHGEALAYVYNHDWPDGSEIGYIGFKPTVAAGLARIW